ncbi:MAG: hypothetical protein CVU05_09035 [Bacteroidetes bacterium HGW-Bacteroidetes-21]|jgi:hypothetical protein|nr:MAG: hypothetical protein CVU05_09035 [Bacteroidetes bacterium HGW-Bacteroidetes-21]
MLDGHNKIPFKKYKYWYSDKKRTGFISPGSYFWGFFPSIFIVISLIADLFSLFTIDKTTLSIILISFLFIYGLINLLLVLHLQRCGIRLKKTRSFFELIHKSVIVKFREYITLWDNNKDLSKAEKINSIKETLTQFNEKILVPLHGKKAVITLKYKEKDRLIPIRIGDAIENREKTPESISDSYVYNALTKNKSRMEYLYVKDVNILDNKELLSLGAESEHIKARASGKYSTFIAVPVRSGELKSLSSDEIQVRKDLGILGFDTKEKYSFGNLDQYELDMMYCLSDLLSIIVEDLIEE